MPTNSVSTLSGARQGILSMSVGMIFFVAQDAIMKDLLESSTIWQLICVRSLLSALILIPIILLLGTPHRLQTPFLPICICRGALMAIGFTMYYTAFPFMTLASVTTILFSAPLFTAVIAALFLKENVGPYRGAALVVGFFGIIVAMDPGVETFNRISILPLMCALTYSISQILMRKVGARESTLTLGLYTLIFAGVFVIPIAWSINAFTDVADLAPHLSSHLDSALDLNIGVLLTLSIVGMFALLFTSRAYQLTDASVVAPFEYIYLPIATTLGYVIWNEIPTWNTLIGMGLIVVSGIYICNRELLHSRRGQYNDTNQRC